MKRLISKIFVLSLGILGILGITPKDSQAITHKESKIENISATTPLYLMHSQDIFSTDSIVSSWHESHYSHSSHYSHQSHYSHYSGY